MSEAVRRSDALNVARGKARFNRPYAAECFHESIGISKDLGTTWQVRHLPDFGDLAAFFTLKGTLYASLTSAADGLPAPGYEFDGSQFNEVPINLLPGAEVGLPVPPTMQPGPVNAGGTLVYLGAYSYGVDPYSLWVADSVTTAKRIVLPGDVRAHDLLLVERAPGDALVVR